MKATKILRAIVFPLGFGWLHKTHGGHGATTAPQVVSLLFAAPIERYHVLTGESRAGGYELCVEERELHPAPGLPREPEGTKRNRRTGTMLEWAMMSAGY